MFGSGSDAGYCANRVVDAYWIYPRSRCYRHLEVTPHRRYVLPQTSDTRASHERRRTRRYGCPQAPRRRGGHGIKPSVHGDAGRREDDFIDNYKLRFGLHREEREDEKRVLQSHWPQ